MRQQINMSRRTFALATATAALTAPLLFKGFGGTALAQAGRRITLEALGGETGKYLSHAFDRVWLQNGVQGDGEVFILERRPNDRVAFACIAGETGKNLSHAFDRVWLQNGVQGEGEEFVLRDQGDGNVALECLGGERGKYLSHAFDRVWLQNGVQGAGELWRLR